MDKAIKGRYFSTELKSKANIKDITFSNDSHENVLVKETIGELVQAGFANDMALVVASDKGIFRVNLTAIDIRKKQEQENEA